MYLLLMFLNLYVEYLQFIFSYVSWDFFSHLPTSFLTYCLPWKQLYQNTCINEQWLYYYFYIDRYSAKSSSVLQPPFNFLFYIEIKNYLIFSLLCLLRVYCCFPLMLQLTCSLLVFEISAQFRTLYYIFSLGDISTALCPLFSVDCCSFSSWTPCFPRFVFLCFCCFIF